MFQNFRLPKTLIIFFRISIVILSLLPSPSSSLVISRKTRSLAVKNLEWEPTNSSNNTGGTDVLSTNAVNVDTEKESHGSYNAWEEDLKQSEKTTLDDVGVTTTEAQTVTTNDPTIGQVVDLTTLTFEYVCNEVTQYGCKSPLLKHYKMYIVDPEDDFYPCWTYHGFHPPSSWHTIPIDFFDKPPLEVVDKSQNYIVRKHGSAMHLCGDEEVVTSSTNACKEQMENQCANSMPSPINIMKTLAVEDPNLSEIVFINYNVYFGFEMFFETDGTPLLFVKFLPHTRDGKRPGIRKGPVAYDQVLYLDRMLIRYGVDPIRGSEHTLNGEYFGMELQFFFTADDVPYWQSLSQYKTLRNEDPRIGQQVHVLTVFVNFTEVDRELSAGNDYVGNSMQALGMAAEKFWGEGGNPKHFSTVRVKKKVLMLEDFFNQPKSGIYYTYQGSLSHPPCLTHVMWTLFEKPTLVSRDIWKSFAYVQTEYSDYRFLAGNARPQKEILVKADIKQFREMKIAQGYGELHQRELDEAAENIREIVNDGNSTKKVDLYLIRKYVDYQNYFSRKVRKSIKPGSQSLRGAEYDYYEEQKDTRQRSLAESGVSSRRPWTEISMITTIAILIMIS